MSARIRRNGFVVSNPSEPKNCFTALDFLDASDSSLRQESQDPTFTVILEPLVRVK